jgi:hypothetical protein
MAGLAVIRKNCLSSDQLFFAEVDGAHRLGVVQRGLALLQNRQLLDGLFVACARHLAHAVNGFFHRGQVGQAELGLDHLDVGDRVHLVGHVDHVVVFKAAHHVDDGIGLADVRQKLVAQAFTGAGTGHQTGDVHELDDGRHHALGLDDGGQLGQAGIGHLDHPVLGSMVQKG